MIHILSTILKACSVSDQAMMYLARQVPPAYNYSRYVEWMKFFLENGVSQLNLDEKQKKGIQEEIDLALKYSADLDEFIQKNH